MISIISNSIVNWKTVLTSGGMALGQVDIRRGIFQGDFSSSLLFIVIMLPLTLALRKMRAGYKLAKDMKPINRILFMDDLKLYGASKDQLNSLVQVVRIFLQDIKMLFGIEKCAVLEMRRGRQVGSSGIELPDHQHIGGLQIPWHLKIGPDSQHQDERQNKIGMYQKPRSCVDQNSMEEI